MAARGERIELRQVLDPTDRTGRKNLYVDLIHSRALDRALAGQHVGLAIDLGCGIGRLTSLLASRSNLVLGVDPDAAMLRAARTNGQGDEVRWIRSDCRRLPVKNASTDLLLSVLVMQHIHGDAALETVTRECARVLKPGGRLVAIEQVARRGTQRLDGAIERRTIVEYQAAFTAAGLQPLATRLVRQPSVVATVLAKAPTPFPVLSLLARMNSMLAPAGSPRHTYADCLFVLERRET